MEPLGSDYGADLPRPSEPLIRPRKKEAFLRLGHGHRQWSLETKCDMDTGAQIATNPMHEKPHICRHDQLAGLLLGRR